ncbi:MAG: sodium-translocating pyrophosphatase [Phycisphaerales bacterium]|nr:sodium-translocating pyrophosphatase [Phycisphaerales bacterium]
MTTVGSLIPTLGTIAEIPPLYWLAPVGGVSALVMAFLFSRSVMTHSEGDEEMIRIADAVRKGAMAYLKRQYRVVAGVFVLIVLFLAGMWALHLQHPLSMVGVPLAGLLSGLCGWFGMKMATNASARTAQAAKGSLNDGLTVAFRSGAVMGLVVVGFAILDVSFWFFVLNGFSDLRIDVLTTVMLSYGMGASTQALFARVGGGIYTKAADVGADLVGKVEAGIPEDDPRNPATIADNVGDNVGDVAGMGADLYESYYGSILATMALGTAAAMSLVGLTEAGSLKLALGLAVTPMALAGIGILCSIGGIFAVRTQENASFAQLLKSLHKGVWIASALIMVASAVLLRFTLGEASGTGGALHGITSYWQLWLSIVVGLIAGNVIAVATEYYTSYEHRPTQRIAEQALTGPATVIIAGIAEGMKSTWASLVVVVIAIIAAFVFAGGNDNFLMGLYGVGIAAVGMLSTLGITLATDAYGPIADNAGGNAEMTSQPPHVRERTDMLDSLGNTTAATGKGFAIGSAALTALALFAAYIQVVQTQLTTQSEAYIAKNGRSQAVPYVMYEGHDRFAIVDPTKTDAKGRPYVDGGMLVDRVQLTGTKFEEQIEAGTVFEVHPEPRLGTTVEPSIQVARRFIISNPTNAEPISLEIISTRNGSLEDVLAFYNVSIANPRVLGGLFVGVMLTFLFCALTMNAVGRAAYAMMRECRRQFGKIRQALRNGGMSDADVGNPDMWPKSGVEFEGKHYPDYAQCVSISTAGAQREMIVPAALAIVVPIVVGLLLNVPGVMGLLAGGLTSGFAVAVFMANAGGAWDNAKKFIEKFGRTTADDFLDNESIRQKIPAEIRDAIAARAADLRQAGNGSKYVYGKGSDDHKATVVGDTVGDPFKDTSGPSLNILIKLISIVSVVFAGLIVKFGPIIGGMFGLH